MEAEDFEEDDDYIVDGDFHLTEEDMHSALAHMGRSNRFEEEGVPDEEITNEVEDDYDVPMMDVDISGIYICKNDTDIISII